MDISPLQELPKKAEKIFKIWKENAAFYFPKHEVFQNDLKDEILTALQNSLNDLNRKGYKKHRENKTWIVGVFMEIFATQLNKYWYNIYIVSDNKDFTSMLWLKAMMLHLSKHQDSIIEVNRIYKQLLDNHYPFDSDEAFLLSENSENDFISDLNYSSNWEKAESYLDQLTQQKLSDSIHNRGPRMITTEKLYKIFTIEEIHQFIELNLYIL
ncbi:hypothetical protein [Flammeovirga sp. SubArs3]|uniref:hypothetical protein n=1 Tax=Flammeovirga sp. SubArs3 TaxID=2995316 RepID=UPI00248CBE6B|nr:hypothetical protein [Flammeovirga sp. SubArs3]